MVRKSLQYNNKFAKKSETKWSGKVFKVVKVVGRSVHLDDDTIFKRENLLKVSQDSKTVDDTIVIASQINKELN